jgi:nucleoside phosphorylase
LEERQASVLKSKGIVCESVVGITSNRIATSKDARAQLAAAGAGVVDMESYEIIAASTQAGVPISVLRIVSDSVDQDLPDFNQAMKPNGDFDGWSALEVALGSPLLTARMISANRRAIQKLTPALEALFASDCFSPARSGKAY